MPNHKAPEIHPWRALFYLLVIGFCVHSFHGMGVLYGKFRHEYGTGMIRIPYGEQSFYLWYLVVGLCLIFAFVRLLEEAGLGRRLVVFGRKLLERDALLLWGGVFWVVLLSFAVRHFVLLHAPVSSDELTLRFVAQTLLTGKVVNPLPDYADYFRNQSIILTERGWYGEHPIGYPLLLAVGESIGWRSLVGALLTGLHVLLVYLIGRRLFSKREALIALLLLVLSPQLITTGATDLSQNGSCLMMLLGIWLVLKFQDDLKILWSWGAGLAFGFCLLIRPFPAVLFFPVLALYLLFGAKEVPMKKRVASLGAGAVGIVLGGAVFLWVNYTQTGQLLHLEGWAWLSAIGQQGPVAPENRLFPKVASSFFGALLRQNVWLFGWPVSFLFLIWARPSMTNSPRLLFVWGMVGAIYAHRLIAPKTFVSTTGPIYVFEAVPLLALISASGIVACARWLREKRLSATLVVSLWAGSLLATGLMFMPVHLEQLGRCGRAYNLSFSLLRRTGSKKKKLVFSNTLIPAYIASSWAHYPPNPSPGMNEPVIFVRYMPGQQGAQRSYAFWKKKFPERDAYVFKIIGRRGLLRPVRRVSDFFVKMPKLPKAWIKKKQPTHRIKSLVPTKQPQKGLPPAWVPRLQPTAPQSRPPRLRPTRPQPTSRPASRPVGSGIP